MPLSKIDGTTNARRCKGKSAAWTHFIHIQCGPQPATRPITHENVVSGMQGAVFCLNRGPFQPVWKGEAVGVGQPGVVGALRLCPLPHGRGSDKMQTA